MRGYSYVTSVALHVAFIALISAFSHKITPKQGEKAQITEIEIEFVSDKLSISKSIPDEKRKSVTKNRKIIKIDSNQKEKEVKIFEKSNVSTPIDKTVSKNNEALRVQKEENIATNSIKTLSINKSKTDSTLLRGGNIKPSCKRCIKPKYPRTALRRNQQGYVLVELSVSAKGRVTKTIILKSSGITSIDNAALKAARKSIFVEQKKDTKFTMAYELKISK